jgi:hypothetical protein
MVRVPEALPAKTGRGRGVEVAAVATAAAFAGGALLSQTVVVPHWRAMDPAAFLARFATEGPITAATVFPFELAAAVLLGITAYRAAKNHRRRRTAWVLATVSILGSLALIPMYFLPANLAMLDPAFPVQAVPAELTTWYAWNWVRTGFGLASAILACIALSGCGPLQPVRVVDLPDPYRGS